MYFPANQYVYTIPPDFPTNQTIARTLALMKHLPHSAQVDLRYRIVRATFAEEHHKKSKGRNVADLRSYFNLDPLTGVLTLNNTLVTISNITGKMTFGNVS